MHCILFSSGNYKPNFSIKGALERYLVNMVWQPQYPSTLRKTKVVEKWNNVHYISAKHKLEKDVLYIIHRRYRVHLKVKRIFF